MPEFPLEPPEDGSENKEVYVGWQLESSAKRRFGSTHFIYLALESIRICSYFAYEHVINLDLALMIGSKGGITYSDCNRMSVPLKELYFEELQQLLDRMYNSDKNAAQDISSQNIKED